jgi:hypothetical protein
MALVGGGNIQVNQDNNDHNDGDADAGNTDQDRDATGMAAASGAAGGTGTTNFNLRVEQNKIPEFLGTKSKDTISTTVFIRRLEDLANMIRWTDTQTYYHFANALCNPAHEWLSSVVDWDDEEHDQPLWSDFKYIFKQEYAVQTNERLILERLANLAMKPSEMMNELLTRITCTTRVIQESFTEYGGITPDPLNDRNDSISNHSFHNFKKQFTAMMFNFFRMNLFKAALTPELQSIVAQQDQEAMTTKKMYQVATTAQREDKSKSMATVSKIRDEEILAEPEDDENNVAAFN